MTKQFLEECIELKDKIRKRCIYLINNSLENEKDVKYNNLWYAFQEKVCEKVGDENYVLISVLIDHIRTNDLTINNLVNVLRELNIEVTE